jgi:myosin regulatory light chain 12
MQVVSVFQCVALLTPSQVDRFLKGPFTDRQGNFNYREWVKVLRINADNDEADPQ